MATSYDLTDEFTKQLARKRRLAELLQQQSMQMQLANPHARASFLNALVPMAQAWAGKSMTDEANTEGMAHQNEVMQKTKAQWDQFMNQMGPHEAMGPSAELMNPPDASMPPPSEPTTRPPTDTGSPLLPPSQQPQNPMAQLLMGQNGPSMGANLAQDQGPPLVPNLGEIGAQAAAPPPPMVPRDMGSINVVGKRATPDPEAVAEQKYGLDPGTLSTFRTLEGSPVGSVNPKSGAAGPYQIMPANVAEYSKRAGRTLDPNNSQDAADMAAQVAADAAKKYPDNKAAQVAYYNGGSAAGDAIAAGKPTNPETTAYLDRWQKLAQAPAVPPMPPQGATPPPTLAGPPVPGAIAPPPDTPPPLVPQPPRQGSAPKMPMIPARTPTAYDMVQLANMLPAGPQQAQFLQEAMKNTLTEPDRVQARKDQQEMIRQNALLNAGIRQQAIQAGMRNTDVRAGTSTANTADRIAASKEIATMRIQGGAQGYGQEYDKLTAAQQSVVDYYATLNAAGDTTWRVGLGRGAGGSNLIKAVDERTPTILSNYGMGPGDAGSIKAQRAANQVALNHNATDLAMLTPYAEMLDKNAQIAKDLAAKVVKTQSPLANKPINWLEQNAAGDPDIAEYLAQIHILQAEAARIIKNPRLVGQMSDENQRGMEAILNGSMSLNATNQVIDRLVNDSHNRIDSMNNQKDFLVESFKKLTPGGGGPAKGAAPATAGGKVREFKTEAEAEASGYKGEAIINGRRAVIE